MSILFFWKGDNYYSDMKIFGKDYELNQNNERMNKLVPGDHIWAFTRRKDRLYVLALDLIVDRVKLNQPNDPGYKYGKYNVLGNTDQSRYFDILKGKNIEPTIRLLSISANAKILGQSFQGNNGVKQLSVSDELALIEFSANLVLK